MITIITPTYNRAYSLPALYASLQRQTCPEFEWVIVDDGSTDNTRPIIEDWQKQHNDFQIRYYPQKNGGKHRAVNKAVQIAKYDYCMIVDSDDYLLDDAVYLIHTWIQEIDGDHRFAGISGLRCYGNGQRIGEYPDSKKYAHHIDCTNLERLKYHLRGDKAEVYRTSLLLKYPFPEFEGENFIPESVSWDRIAQAGYMIRWYNRNIYVCEYMSDGLTKNISTLRSKNFEGTTYYVRQGLQNRSLVRGISLLGYYCQLAEEKGLTNQEISERLAIKAWRVHAAAWIYRLKRKIKRH